MYWNFGDRSMGDYYNDKPIRKHAVLTRDGIVKEACFPIGLPFK